MVVRRALALRRQYGLDSCVPVIANLYGPEDNFDLGRIADYGPLGEIGIPLNLARRNGVTRGVALQRWIEELWRRRRDRRGLRKRDSYMR
jgi:hypothetical protein